MRPRPEPEQRPRTSLAHGADLRMRLRVGAILKWTGIALAGVAVLLAGTAAFFLFAFDWNALRDTAGTRGSAALGRDLAIEGALDIQPGWRVWRVHAEGVRLANAEWARTEGSKEPNMLQIERVDASIEIWELLRGRIVLPELNFVRPQIVIEKLDEDRKNWKFGQSSKKGPSKKGPDGGKVAKEAVAPEDRTEFPVIGRLTIEGGRLVYRDAPAKLFVDTKVSMAIGTGGDDEEQLIEFEGRGTLQNEPFLLTVTGGSLLTLRDPDKPYPLRVDIRAGPTRFFAEGKMDDPLQMKGIDVRLEASGKNLADIFTFTAIPTPPTPPYDIRGRLVKEGERWTFHEFRGQVGGSDLGGHLEYDAQKERAVVRVDLVSERLNFEDLKGFIGADPEKKDEERDRVLPDAPLNLERLRATDLDVRLRAKRITAPNNLPLDDMDSRFVLDRGLLTVDPLTFGVAGGTIAGAISLDGRKDIPGVQTSITMRGLSLKSFFTGKAMQELFAGRFGGRIVLTGVGPSLAEVLGSSNGRLTATMSGGELSLLAMEAAGLDVAEGLARLLGQDRSTGVRCIVGDFKVEGGVAASQALVIDTDDTRLDGNGTIDLKHERLGIRLLANPKDPGPLAARTPITVRGTMKEPKIGIETVPLLARGAAALGLGAVFPPLAAIPFTEFGLGEDSDCNALLQQTADPGDQREPAPAAPPPGSPAPPSQKPGR